MPRLILFRGVNITNFQMHDMQLVVDPVTPNFGIIPEGITNYGIYLRGCTDYQLIRFDMDIARATDGSRPVRQRRTTASNGGTGGRVIVVNEAAAVA